jgi:hypothetical protein
VWAGAPQAGDAVAVDGVSGDGVVVDALVGEDGRIVLEEVEATRFFLYS